MCFFFLSFCFLTYWIGVSDCFVCIYETFVLGEYVDRGNVTNSNNVNRVNTWVIIVIRNFERVNITDDLRKLKKKTGKTQESYNQKF